MARRPPKLMSRGERVAYAERRRCELETEIREMEILLPIIRRHAEQAQRLIDDLKIMGSVPDFIEEDEEVVA